MNAEPEPESETNTATELDTATTETVTTEEAPPKVGETEAPESKPERTDWKQKYLVLQGKYDKEVPRLHQQLRDSDGRVGNLQDQLNQLNITVAAMQEVQKEPKPVEPMVSQDEIDQFGPDLIDIVERVAKQAVSPYVDQKVGEVAKSVRQVDESVASQQQLMAKSARESLWASLDAQVEGWSEINRDPVFLDWLKETDWMADVQRGVLLRQAFERNDTDRVVKFFKSFQQEHAVEAGTASSDAPEQQEVQESQQNLENLVAPGAPKTGATGTHEESGKGRIWSQKDITSFYLDKNEFIKQHPERDIPERMVALENDLFKAQAEGRIR
jgi:hypothetical protein